MKLLEGVQVLDFTRLLPGPMATLLLGQMGAQVKKVEHPGRKDYARDSGPHVDGASILFHMLNQDKEMLSLEYEAPENRTTMEALIRECDVLIEQFRPGAMEAWGLGYEALKAVNPRLIYISLTGYGQTGSLANRAGHDLNYLAMSGLLGLNRDAEGAPVVPGYQMGDIGGGSYAVVMACLAGLFQREQTGEGCFMDVSMTDALMPFLGVPLSLAQSGLNPKQFNVLDGRTVVNYGVYQCQDGRWLAVGALELKFWNRICELVGNPEWKRNNPLELSVLTFPRKEVEALFSAQPRSYWLDLLESEDTCVSPVLELDALSEHPLHMERENFSPFHAGSKKALLTFSFPIKSSR